MWLSVIKNNEREEVMSEQKHEYVIEVLREIIRNRKDNLHEWEMSAHASVILKNEITQLESAIKRLRGSK